MQTGMNLFAFAIGILLALAYPITVLLQLRSSPSEAYRWLKNSPSFNFFMVLLFPTAVAIFISAIDRNALNNIWIHLHTAWVVIISIIIFILLMIAQFATLDDLKRVPLEPYMLNQSQAALQFEMACRDRLRDLRNEIRKVRDKTEIKRLKEELAKLHTKSIEDYIQFVPPFSGIKGLRARGSSCAFVALILNGIVAIFIVVLFVYLAATVIYSKSNYFAHGVDPLLVVVGLLITWFPIRLYAEWYLNFYSLKHLRTYYAFWLLMVAMIIAYFFLAFNTQSVALKAISAAGPALLLAIGTIGKIKPDWLIFAADIIEEMPNKWYVSIMCILAIGLIVISASLVGFT